MHNGQLTAPAPEAGTGLGESVAEFLRLNIEPLARHCGVALAFAPADATDPVWLSTTVERLDPTAREILVLRCRGLEVGKVWLCGGPSEVRRALRASIESALTRMELEATEEAHLENLYMSSESLDAVYEISSQIWSGRPPAELLDDIMNRAAVMRSGLRVVLWLVRDGVVEPVAGSSAHLVAARPLDQGVLGKVLGGKGFFENGCARVAPLVAEQPELAHASAVLMTPAITKHALKKVVLEIWAEDGGEFGSPMMKLAETLARHAAMVLENEQLQAELLERNSLREEAAISARIQEALLVGQPPASLHFEVGSLTLPSREGDGDFYDFFSYPNGTLDVLLGDVMGKGVPAALTGAAAKNQFLRSLAHKFAAAPGADVSLPELLLDVQRGIASQLIELECFITLVYARFDAPTRSLQMIDCGHTASLHFRAAEGIVERLMGDNLPLGVLAKEQFVPVCAPFAPGDLFFFYSDGITEARGPVGEEFGWERLAECVRRHGFLCPKELIAAIRREVVAFHGSEVFTDDFSCVAIAVRGTAPQRLDAASDLNELTRVRAFVRSAYAAATEEPPAEEWLAAMELAATEVFSNLVRHAYAGRPDEPIRIVAGGDAETAELCFSHRGVAFAGEEAVELEAPQEEGMGLFIIRQSVDRVEYRPPTDGWSCVHLVKHWPHPNEARSPYS
jgi:sigma-B regulation protein RsbU (phosphoserine phosphatase)